MISLRHRRLTHSFFSLRSTMPGLVWPIHEPRVSAAIISTAESQGLGCSSGSFFCCCHWEQLRVD